MFTAKKPKERSSRSSDPSGLFFDSDHLVRDVRTLCLTLSLCDNFYRTNCTVVGPQRVCFAFGPSKRTSESPKTESTDSVKSMDTNGIACQSPSRLHPRPAKIRADREPNLRWQRSGFSQRRRPVVTANRVTAFRAVGRAFDGRQRSGRGPRSPVVRSCVRTRAKNLGPQQPP